MKATVDIPSDELREAMRFTKSKTKREAIRLEPDAVPSRFGDGPEESEATALAVHGVLPGGERDVSGFRCRALVSRVDLDGCVEDQLPAWRLAHRTNRGFERRDPFH